MRSGTMRLLVYGMLSLIATACTLSSKLTPEELRSNQAQGMIIVQAVNRYTLEHNQFPVLLADLVPEYVSEIPRTTFGKDFVYRRDHLDGYQLCFAQGNGCCYRAQLDIWDCFPGGVDH